MYQKISLPLITAIIVLLTSCTPDPPPTPSSSNLRTSFIFTVNGQTDSIIGSLSNNIIGSEIRKGTYSNNSPFYSYYQFLSTKRNTNGNQEYAIVMNLYPTDTLVADIYTFDFNTRNNIPLPSRWCTVDEADFYKMNLLTTYASINATDQAQLTITNIHNGYADGIITSVISNANPNCSTCPSTVNFNGVFKNVKIIN